MKVLFIYDYPVSERDARRCGFQVLKRRGFTVDAWDITAALHPDVAREVSEPDPLESAPVRRFDRMKDVVAAVGALPAGTFIFAVVYYQLGAIPLYRAIGARGLSYGVIVANALPVPPPAPGVSALAARVKRLTPRAAVWRLVRRLPFSWLGVPPAALVVAGGEQSLASQSGFYPVDATSRVVWTHTLDYDHYLEERTVARPHEPGRAVFLDEYLPFHPDFTYLKMKPPSTAEAYYPRLREYFDFLEREHGVQVVVAAHPRSSYEKHPDYFGTRPVIRGRTVELVRSADFVIAHCSTSLNYAVMFERPVVFVTTDDIDAGPVLGRYILELSRRFSAPRLNLNQPRSTWTAARGVDRNAYREYRTAYIKKDGSPDQPCWEIVADALERIAA